MDCTLTTVHIKDIRGDRMQPIFYRYKQQAIPAIKFYAGKRLL